MPYNKMVGYWLLSLCFLQSANVPPDRVRLFLGPPSNNVFAQTGGGYRDTYDDIRRHYRDDPQLQAALELVTSPELADIVLMITYRGKVGTLRRTNQVSARLFVTGAEHSTDLDGVDGINWGTFSNQAKSLLRQTAQWANANKASLPRFKRATTTTATTAIPSLPPTSGGLFLPSPADQTPGVELVIQESSRKAGPQGTTVGYRIKTSGFPQGVKYTYTIDLLEDDIVVTDVEPDAAGALRSGRVNGRKIDLGRMAWGIHHYTRGEAYTIRVISSDGRVTAAATTFPFPIQARSGDCLIWIEVASADHQRHNVRGRGLAQGDEVELVRLVGGTRSSVKAALAPDGTFVQPFTDEGDGEATVSVMSTRCQCTAQYGFGANGRRIQ